VQDPIFCSTIPKEDMKNMPNILLMLVDKTQRKELIYLTNVLNNFQIMSGTCKLYGIFVECLV